MALKNLYPALAKVIFIMAIPISASIAQIAPRLCEKDIPNIITPNDDNCNDTFCLPCDYLSGWHLKICNRWGKLIYENKDYKNEWDGDNFCTGVYFYQLENKTSEQTMKGWVTILK